MVTAAMCIIYDKDKEILLEKRTDNGMWGVPRGALELGETLEEALKSSVNGKNS